ncbi:MAG: cofactor-independent phosphoglycerate mutase [Candidatus Omnitrophica bacterium]|nr:cofactor-independent phosphoglycerate mutase [Candidatus Omnitrophota bacterium]
MKYIVLVADGMADRPLKELDGKTPIESARKPNMDYMVKNGQIGRAVTIPSGLEPASDVANLAILGYDPKKYYSGRGPLEAANMGVELGEFDIAFRCNLITASGDVMADYSAGHISSKEAQVLIRFIDEKLGKGHIKFYPGVSYRHLMVVKPDVSYNIEDLKSTACVPPHNILSQKISKNLPKGKGAEFLIKLMEESRPALESHEVNKVRLDLKENPANMIWLWGQGSKPSMPSFREKFGLIGSIISAVDLIKGIGKIIGLDPINVPGATGYYDTDYKAKAEYAIKSLEHKDFVFVHVEAPDEAGHNGDVREKLLAIENFDSLVVGTILKHFKDNKNFRIMVLPDHATPISIRTHSVDPIPFAIYGKDITPDQFDAYSEKIAYESSLVFNAGWDLMGYFTGKGK